MGRSEHRARGPRPARLLCLQVWHPEPLHRHSGALPRPPHARDRGAHRGLHRQLAGGEPHGALQDLPRLQGLGAQPPRVDCRQPGGPPRQGRGHAAVARPDPQGVRRLAQEAQDRIPRPLPAALAREEHADLWGPRVSARQRPQGRRLLRRERRRGRRADQGWQDQALGHLERERCRCCQVSRVRQEAWGPPPCEHPERLCPRGQEV
mmetsp:Transcript_48933/g.122283  ORF Transcript_48933/g.122283 Transcript_48933/m.122283 type:complete len:207 (-) Transcript_48933:783-1403(-)